MSLLVIDDQGELWRGDSRQLRANFDSPYSGGEFIEYAAKNLGFIAINLYTSSCQLRLRPSFVTARTANGLLNWMRGHKFERVVLTIYESGWRDTLLKPHEVEQRIEGLAATQAGQFEKFMSRPLQPPPLEGQTILADVFSNWRHLAATYDTDTLVRLLRSVFDQRYAVMLKQAGSGRLVFKEFGHKMFPQYDIWRTCAVGAPVEEQPDRAYGKWVARTYHEALESEVPRSEAVDAITNCPVRGHVRMRYRRIIFPLNEPSGSQLLIGGSFDDRSIDLRVPAR
ncbi:MAG: hypothetical protein SFW09_03975 [Hyphomicrobiaceae bacterium]|nr:hypothetical protein [Hyphomicrobiaceae bacterium]